MYPFPLKGNDILSEENFKIVFVRYSNIISSLKVFQMGGVRRSKYVTKVVSLVVLVCVKLLQPSQPVGVISSTVSLPNHILLDRLGPLSS